MIICWDVEGVLDWNADDWFDEIVRTASDANAIICTDDYLMS